MNHFTNNVFPPTCTGHRCLGLKGIVRDIEGDIEGDIVRDIEGDVEGDIERDN